MRLEKVKDLEIQDKEFSPHFFKQGETNCFQTGK